MSDKLREALDWLCHLHNGCRKAGHISPGEWEDAIKNGMAALADTAEHGGPPSDAAPVGFDSSGPWTAFSTVLYKGREYAMVMQRDRPWFCSRAGDDERWVVEAAAPPSDAAPVAQLLYDTMPDMISAILVENEIDPFVYAAKWAAAIGPLYAHPALKKTPENLHSGEAIKGNLHSEDAPGGPKIVCLCGSSRFVAEMAIVAWNLETEGAITMGLHLLPHWYTDKAHHQAEHEGIAEKMDALHLSKIDLADEVFVVNVGGYYGDSTAREIMYARDHGKPVRFLEDKITREPPVEVEDAPGGPWQVMETGAGWFVLTTGPCRHFGSESTSWMTETEAIAVRDALNRLKGEGKTDG